MRRNARPVPCRLRRGTFEALEYRRLLAITPSFLAGTLGIVITGNENVAISSDGLNVLINGSNPGIALSAAVQAIVVTATDPTASNTIDVTGVTSSLFSFLGFGAITLDGGEGADTYLINQSVLPGVVNVADTGVVLAGGDSVQITTSSVAAESIGVSAAAVTRSSGPAVNYLGIESLTVSGTGAGDTISVTGTGATTVIDGLGGADTFTAIDPATIAHSLTLNAGAGAVEQLIATLSGAAVVDISSSTVQQSGFGSITYSGFERLVVNGSGATDTFNIHSTATSMLVTVFGGGGVDTFNVTDLSDIAALGALGVDGGGNGDFLTVQAGLLEGPVNIASGNVVQGGHGTVAYSNFGTLTVNGTAAIDSFVLGATNAATLTKIFGLGGADSFSTIGLSMVGAAGLLLDAGGDGEALTMQAMAGQGTVVVDSSQVKQGVHGAAQYLGFANLTVQGTAAIDDFDVNSTAAGVVTAIDALASADTFQPIDLSTIGAAGGSLTVDAGDDGEMLTVNAGSGGTVSISGAAVQQTGSGAVNYLGFGSLLAGGVGGDEVFNVVSTSIATTIDADLGNDTVNVGSAGSLSGIAAALTINGEANDPLPTSALDSGSVVNALPVGDTLHLDDSAFATGGTTYTLGASTFTRTGLPTITFNTVETIVLDAGSGGNTIDVTGTAASVSVTVNGGIGVDTITLVTSGSTSNVSLNAGAGADILTIQSVAAGSVVIASGQADPDSFTAIDLTSIASTAGLLVDAGGDGELLTVDAGSGATVSISGTVVQQTGSGPIDYTGFGSLLANGAAGAEVFNVLSTSIGTTIDAGLGNDTVNVGNAGSLSGIAAALTINGQGNDAAPTSALNSGSVSNILPVGDTLHLDDSAFATPATIYTLSASTFTRTGLSTITFGTVETVVLDAGSGGNTIDVTGTAASVNVTVNGGIGADNITLVGNGASSNVTFNAGDGADTLSVQSVAAGSVVIANGQADPDTFTAIDLTAIAAGGGLLIDAGGGSETLTLNVATSGVVSISSTVVQRTGNGTIDYTGFENLAVNGTSGIDTFNIASTAAGTATTVNADGSTDLFGAIDLTTIGAAGLTIDADAGAGELLTLNVVAAAGTTTITSSTVQRAGNGLVTYSDFESLIVNGTTGVDTFNVLSTAAGTQTTVNADDSTDLFGAIDLTTIGAAGLMLDADSGAGEILTLNVSTAGTTTITATTVQRTGNGLVTYSDFESLLVGGTAGVDTFNVLSTSIGTTVDAGLSNDVFNVGNAGSLSGIAAALTINGQANDATPTTTLNSGSVSNLLPVGDTLHLDDSAHAAAATYTLGVSTFTRTGLPTITFNTVETIVLDGGTVGNPINITGTAASVNVTVNGGIGGDTITLVSNGAASNVSLNGGAGADTLTIQSVAAGSVVIASGGADPDTFTAIDLTTIALTGGLRVDAGGASETLTLNVSISGVASISSTVVQRAGNGTVDYVNVENLMVNGTSGVDTFSIASTAAGTATTVNADNSTDLFGPIDLTTIGAAGLTIDADLGAAELLTLNVSTPGTTTITATTVGRTGNGVVTYSDFESLVVNGTSGVDTFNVLSTAAGTQTMVNANGSTDLFGAIDLTTIGLAGLTIDADGGAGELLTLNVGTAGTTTITSTTVQRPTNGVVTYTDFEQLVVNGTGGADTFNIVSTAAGTQTTVNANGSTDLFGPIDLTTVGLAGLTIDADGGTGELLTLNVVLNAVVSISSTVVQRTGNGAVTYSDFETLIVNGTANVDTFNIASTAAGTATAVNANGSTDLFGPLNLATIGTAGLTIDADGGVGEILNVNIGTAGTATLTSTTMQRAGNGLVTYTDFETLNLNGTSGVDAIDVLSTLATVGYTINSNDGNDTITLGNAGLLDGILGTLTVHGDAHSAAPTTTLNSGSVSNTLPVGDTLRFNDSAKAGGATYTLNGTLVRAGMATVTFDTVETIILDTGTGGDTITLPTTSASVNVTVNSGAGNDTINLQTNGATSNVTLNGGANDDILNILAVAAGSVVFANGGTDNDTVNVSSDAPANNGTLNGIAGGLRVDTGTGTADKLIVSDRGQAATPNGAVEVRNNRINGFAGATNTAQIDYLFGGALELTLLGSNTLDDKFRVILPSAPGLTMRFDGGGGTDDDLRIDGTTGNDVVQVGDFASGRAFQIQNMECLKMFGADGADTLDNGTATSSLIDGGAGNDILIGGSATDVIFGGDGVDQIFGNGGNDWLFGDHIYNNGTPIAGPAVAGDQVNGGTGADTIVVLGSDIVNAGGDIGDIIIGANFQMTTMDWLRARFLNPNSTNINAAIAAAMAQHCAQP